MKISVWQTQYLFSGQSAVDVQQNVCLAGGGCRTRCFFQVDWNTGRENLSRRHRRLVQDALTHWQPVELAKQRLGIRNL